MERGKKFEVLAGLVCAAIVVCAAMPALAGCASSSKPVSAGSAAMSTDLPDWYLNPPEDDGMIYGSGSAKMGNESRTQRAAENRARESVAFQIRGLVDAMQRDYTND